MSTETVPKGYKRTEVGVIPEEWELASIASVIREPIRNGYSPVCPTEDTGIWILSLAAVTNNGFNENGIKPAPRTDPRIDENLLERNDIVVSRSNTPERVGLAGIYNGTPDKCAYPDLLMRVRLNSKVQSNFLLSQLLSRTGRKYFLDNARGSSGSMVKIDRIILQNFPVLLPSETEQQAIAAALSDADALIEALEQLLAKKRQIKQGAMQELLTGKRRLPGFQPGAPRQIGQIPDEWQSITLGEIIISLADYTANGSFEALRINVTYYQEENFAALVRTTDLERKTFKPERFTDKTGYSFLKKTALYGGEIVIANVGSVGKAYRVPFCGKPMTLAPNTYLLKFDPSCIDENFISHWMQTGDFVNKLLEKVGSTTLLAINKSNLRSIALDIPPLPEQSAIAAVLSDMDAQLEALEAKLDKARQIKQGMMQQLLTGKVRLV